MLRLVVAAQRVQEFQSGNGGWVLAVYLINLACIGVNWIVYFRNRRLDAQREIAYEAAEA